MTNIAELLEDCPKGTKLYSPLFGEVEFEYISASDTIWVCLGKTMRMFSSEGRYRCSVENITKETPECLLFPSKDCRTWEGWKRPSKPKFKVGDCLYHNTCGIHPILVKGYSERQGYEVECIETSYYLQKDVIENEYHFWTIADAKDGDVLVTTKIRNCPFIYRKTSRNNGLAYYYAGVDGDGNFCEGCLKRTLYHFGSVENVVPATKEQRDLLFAKMREAGYEWDADKKELRKIQHHYNIADFHEGMPVLVRDDNGDEWNYLLFSHYRKKLSDHFSAGGSPWFQCIPYNDDTKHLLGTTDMPNEEYINW